MNKIKDPFVSNLKVLKNQVAQIDYLMGTVDILPESDINEPQTRNTEKLRTLFNSKLDKTFPDTCKVVLIPSYTCNLKCDYCYEIGAKDKIFSYTEKNINSIVSAIKEQIDKNNYKFISVTLMGGEPLLPTSLKYFSKILPKIHELGLPVEITCVSNGTLVTSAIDQIQELQISSIQITIDGPQHVHNVRRPVKNKKHNNFSSILQGIDLLLEKNITVAVRINIDEENIIYLQDLNNLFIEKKWGNNPKFIAYAYPISESGSDPCISYSPEVVMLRKTLKEYKKIPKSERVISLNFHGLTFLNHALKGERQAPQYKFCAAMLNQLVFDSSGNIHSCWYGEKSPAFKVGSYTDKNKGHNFDQKQLLKWNNKNVSTIPECSSCKYMYVCGGGCSYKALYKPNRPSQCIDYDGIFKEYINFYIEDESIVE